MRAPNNQLSIGQSFKLRDFLTQEYSEGHLRQVGYERVAQAATQALGFRVTYRNVFGLIKAMEDGAIRDHFSQKARSSHTKSVAEDQDLLELKEKVTDMDETITMVAEQNRDLNQQVRELRDRVKAMDRTITTVVEQNLDLNRRVKDLEGMVLS